MINFSANFFKSFLLNGQYLENFAFLNGNVLNAVIDINESDKSSFIELLNKLVIAAEFTGKFQTDRLRIKLLNFFFLIAEIKGESVDLKSADSHKQVIFQSFIKLIDEHYLQLGLPEFISMNRNAF